MSAAREMASLQQPAAIPLAWGGEVQLMLPIHEQQVTAVGYHPVDDTNVVSLRPNGHQVNDSVLSNLAKVTSSEGPGYFVMDEGGNQGSVTNALDVGAPAGTYVFAPVDGTILGIRSYNLKGRCPDTEIKIQPLNQSSMTVVLTHIGNIQATLGQPVKAGVTRIASVRQMDSCVEQQLGHFTYDSGNHVHIQVEAQTNSQIGR